MTGDLRAADFVTCTESADENHSAVFRRCEFVYTQHTYPVIRKHTLLRMSANSV